MQIGDPVDGTDFPGPGAQSWRTLSGLVVGLIVLAVVGGVGAVLQHDPIDRAVSALLAGTLLLLALAGGRRRLVGGPRGVLVVGLTRARVIPWSTVRRVAAGRNRRLGSATLEIDLEDDELLLFSRIELGTDPTDVSAALSRWFADRSAAPGG